MGVEPLDSNQVHCGHIAMYKAPSIQRLMVQVDDRSLKRRNSWLILVYHPSVPLLDYKQGIE